MEKLTLRFTERKRKLKVTALSEHLCEYAHVQLEEFGIEEGKILEIDPDFVSQVLVDVGGREILLGYEKSREIILGEKRLTELSPGETGKVSRFEGGYEDCYLFKELGIDKETKIKLLSYPPMIEETPPAMILHYPVGSQFVLLQKEKLTGTRAIEYILVKVKKGIKQLSLMDIGEEGIIEKTIVTPGEEKLFDELWLREGVEVKMLYKKQPSGSPLLVNIGEKKRVVGEHLTDKIFVEYV
ncbi:MAG: FeoA family protein [Campylobacterota bacterium]|nr:FeoA family protein [Campylobacterota bacterium]